MAVDTLNQSIGRVFEEVFSPPPAEAFVRSGSFRLQLSFADRSSNDRFLPSFSPCGPGAVDLTIGFLTGAEADLFDYAPRPREQPAAVVGDDWAASWQPGDLPVLYLFERKSRRALIWLAAGAAPYWIVSRPTLPLMYYLSIGTPWLTLHAAAVARGGRTVLLVGGGRSGKSTAALACSVAGWDYVGDDYVYVNTVDGRVEPLYRSARLRADMEPALSSIVTPGSEFSGSGDEARYELRLDPGRVRGGKLAAILLPRRRSSLLPEFAPARPRDALAALYTSMTLVQFGWPETTIKKMTSLLSLAPIAFVDTGQSPAAIPGAFARFLERL
jgi:hypothetical protein